MKNKIVALMLSIATVCALAINASAAVVPSATLNVVPELTTKVEGVTVTAGNQSKDVQAAHQEIVAAGSVSAFVKNAKLSVQNAEKLAVAAMFDVTVDSTVDTTKPVTLTFKVDGVKAGSTVVVLHKGANGWEVLKSSVNADGTVSATFANGFSPVVILTGAAASNGTVTSPITGDINFEGVLVAGALVCVAGLALGLVRRKAV